jgi:hypothetical protein
MQERLRHASPPPDGDLGGGSCGRTPRPWRVSVDTMWTPLIQNESAALWRRFSNILYWFLELGAGEGIRTPDPNLGKVVLYP